MQQLKCEFEIFKEDDAWIAMPLGIPGATEGYTFDDAVDMACDWLKAYAEHLAARNLEVPETECGLPLEHNGTRVIVCVPVGREHIDAISASEAALLLNVSRARVSKLVFDRKLEGWKEGRNCFVTRESVVARLKDPKPKGGRPKKKRLFHMAASF